MARHLIWLAAAPAIVLAGRCPARAAKREVALAAAADRSCLFAGRRTELELTATASEALEGAAGWALAVSGSTIARGEIPLEVAPGQTVRFAVPLDVPAVREGAVLEADLAVDLYASRERQAAAKLRRRLWIYSPDAFAGRSKWLETLRIRLFDPAGRTRDVFEKTGIPFSQTANAESLTTAADALVVIGEGVSLEAHRGLPGIMVQAAARGTPIVCLAPALGRMPLPGSDDAGWPGPEKVSLRRASVIVDLDKRLDAAWWPPEGVVASRSLALSSHRGRVVLAVIDRADGWPWLEVDFPAKRGRLIICCFDLIESWDAGPVPRFLLARLLEYLDGEIQ